MKGARRTRKPREQTGFADLMTSSPSSNSLLGVVTGVSRAQRSHPTTPTPTRSNPTTPPPPPEDDWGALLKATPKRRFSPQKPNRAPNTPHSSSSRSSSTLSPRRANSIYSPRRTPSTPSPRHTPPPHRLSHSFASPPVAQTPPSNAAPQLEKSTAVPAFLSGWDGADGWGDDPPLDESDHETQDDPWGVWPESEDILTQTQPDNVLPPKDRPSESQPSQPLNVREEPHVTPPEPELPKDDMKSSPAFDDFSGWAVEEPPKHPAAEHVEPDTQQTEAAHAVAAEDSSILPSVHTEELPKSVPPADPHTSRDTAEAIADFDGFSGWPVEEPPKQPVAEHVEPDSQQAEATPVVAAEDSNIPTYVEEEVQPESVPLAGPQVPGDEPDAAASGVAISGWDAGEPPKQPVTEYAEHDLQQTDATHATASEDSTVPSSAKEEAQFETVPTAELLAPEDETNETAGFGDFSGWAVQKLPQQSTVDFPEQDAQQVDVALGAAVEDSNIPTSARVQTEGVPTTDLNIRDEADAAAGVDGFSGPAVEEMPQQPVAQFPESNTQQTDLPHTSAAEDSNITATRNEAKGSETLPITEAEPPIPGDEAGATADLDTFSGWAVEEPPKQPVPEFLPLDAQKTDAGYSSSGQDVDLNVVPNEHLQLLEVVPEQDADARAAAAVSGDDPHPTTAVELAPEPHGIVDSTGASATDASAQPDPSETSLAGDLWTFNNTSADVSGDDSQWGWGDASDIPPVQRQPAEDSELSKETVVTVSSNPAREITTGISQVTASVFEEGKDEGVENPNEAAFVKQNEAEPEQSDSQSAVLTEQPSARKKGWEPNDGANEVSLDDWGWGGQTEGDAVDFRVGVNSSELQMAGPPPSTSSHMSAPQAPAKDWWNSNEDQSFLRKEESLSQNDTVNRTVWEPDPNSANTHPTTMADFSMYAPNTSNAERDDTFETPQVDGASYNEDPMIAARPDFKPPGREAESAAAGVAEALLNEVGSAQEGAVARQEENAWTTSVGVPDLNIPWSSTGPTLVTAGVPPPPHEPEKVIDLQTSGTQPATEAPLDETNKDSSKVPYNASLLWSGYDEVPQAETDRSWANPDAIWSAPPMPDPSVVTTENENKKDDKAKGEPAMETKHLSESTPAAALPMIQDHEPTAKDSILRSAADTSAASFQNDVALFQHYGGEPDTARTTSDAMMSTSGKHSHRVLDEKNKQNENSTGAVDWQHSLHSHLQPRMPDTSSVTESAQPQSEALSNSYWTERLDESKSVVPENGNKTAIEALPEPENAEEYENTNWPPLHEKSQTEPMTKSASSHSDAYTGAHGIQLTESASGLWPSSTEVHQNVPPNLQWSAPELAHDGNDVASQPEIVQKPLNIDRDVSSVLKGDHREVGPSEQSTTDAMATENSLPVEWNQYAPRDNSVGDRNPPSVPSPESAPLRPGGQSTPEKHGTVLGKKVISADESTYDPFAMYPDELTLDKTKASYEAFDWGYEPQESSSNPQTFTSASHILEGREVNEGEFRSQHDVSSPAQSTAHNTVLQSNITQTPSSPNVDTTVQQPPVNVLPQAFQIQDGLQTGSLLYQDWNASEREGQLQSHEKRPSAQPGSSGISFQADPASVVQLDSQMDSEGLLGHPTARNQYDLTTISNQKSQSSSSGIDADSYAPRPLASRPPTENTSPTGQESSLKALDVENNKSELPQVSAPLERTAPTQTPQHSHVSSYQAVMPDPPVSYPMDMSYAPSVPPVPVTATNGSIYPQTGGEGIEFPPSITGPEISTAPMYHPSSHSTIPGSLAETPEMHVKDPNYGVPCPDQDKREAGLSGDGLIGQPYASSHSPDQHVVSRRTVPMAPELSPDPWSTYSAREVPGGTSVTSETTATQWSNLGSAYNKVDNLGHGQVGGGYDTFPSGPTETYASYPKADEPNYKPDLPPPPQQIPYKPASYLGEQDMFQSESIVDPAAFSYPYSIMDTEITGDFSTRPQRPLFSWGFGGQLVTLVPRVSTVSEEDVSNGRTSAEATSSPSVHIHDLKDITREGSNDDWVAASEAVLPVSFPTRTSDLSSYAEMCDRLSKLSVGLKGAEAEGRSALWRVLALRCREVTSDWRLHAPSAVSGPSSVPMFGRNESSSLLPGFSNVDSILKEGQLESNTSVTKKVEAATEVERLLTLGRGMDAIDVAQEAGLWSIALVLAATMDRSHYLKVVSGYAKSALHDGSALQTLCLSVAEDETEILRKATSPSGLKEWRKTVGILLTSARSAPSISETQQSRFLRIIDQIGEALFSQNSDVVASHVCFMISGRLGPLDKSNIQLLGADPKLPAGQPRGLGSPAAVLQSLVLEAVENAASGATYPHLLPHRLVLAEEICAVGRPEVALAHCESISSAVRSIFESGRQDIASQCFTLPFLSRLEALEQRLLVHLDKVDKGTRKGGLTALGKSLSSVFKKGLTTVSRGAQPQRGENRRELAQPVGALNMPSLPPQPGPAASPPLHPTVSTEHPSNVAMEPNWTPSLAVPTLQPQSAVTSSSIDQSEQPASDASRNEGWNSLVSKTIGFLAPADGDLSPPLKARNDHGVPFHAQPAPLGLAGGSASRVPTLQSHVGHMRSASVGDVPVMERREPTVQMPEQSTYSHQVLQGSHSQTGSNHNSATKPLDQTTFNGVPVHKTSVTESQMSPTHRRAASDMTFESQTSEKKPPRPPKKLPTLPSGMDLQPKREKVQAAKGWRSRLSEKIRAAFSGPPRAHMGVENKFKYDKERGRWVIEGEDPDENNDEPPPPPEDEPTPGGQMAVPYSQSYESLPNPDLGNYFPSDSQTALYQSDTEFNKGGSQMERVRRYSHSGQIALGNIPADNGYARDTGSESSSASAASAPVPYSSEPIMPAMANPGNKFRARPGRASRRRAYVDTLNKGTPPVAMSAAFPNPARPRPPVMNGAGSQAGGGYRIFTPSPVPISHGSSDESVIVPGNTGVPVTSSTVHSNDNLYQTRAAPPSENGPRGGSFENDVKPRAPVQSA